MKTRIGGQPANGNLRDDDVVSPMTLLFQCTGRRGLRFSIGVAISAEAAETTRGDRNQHIAS